MKKAKETYLREEDQPVEVLSRSLLRIFQSTNIQSLSAKRVTEQEQFRQILSKVKLINGWIVQIALSAASVRMVS